MAVYKKRTTRKMVPRKKTYKKKVPKNIKRYVKSAISVRSEDKVMMLSYFNSPILTPGSSGVVPTAFDLTPSIAQGVGRGQRVGSVARIKSAYLNWRWQLSGASQTAGVDMPLFVYMMIARPRNDNAAFSVTETDQLFYSGGQTVSQFDSGDAQANWFLPNKDFWDVRYWTRRPIKLGSQTGSGTTNYANNSFQIERSGVINMGKIYNKILRFNNASSTPQGNTWYLICFVQKYDYTVVTTNWDPPSITLQQNIKFEDS